MRKRTLTYWVLGILGGLFLIIAVFVGEQYYRWHVCNFVARDGKPHSYAVYAGGIADGRQVAAALCLGAAGIQIGTSLLVSEECPIHDNYKAELIKARDNSTTVTGRSLGAPVRIIKNPMAREYLKLEAAAASRDELEQITLGGLRRAVFDGDMKNGSVMAGQVCGQLKEVRPLADILADMYQGAKKVLEETRAIEL